MLSMRCGALALSKLAAIVAAGLWEGEDVVLRIAIALCRVLGCCALISGVCHAQDEPSEVGQELGQELGMTIAEVEAVMSAEGLITNIIDDGEAGGVQSHVSGVDFDVFAINCTQAGRCTEFLFIVGFDLPSGFPLQQINDWNATRLAGRAYLDQENDPFLDHVISVSGPMDAGAFREGLFLWAAVLDEFIDFIELPSSSV